MMDPGCRVNGAPARRLLKNCGGLPFGDERHQARDAHGNVSKNLRLPYRVDCFSSSRRSFKNQTSTFPPEVRRCCRCYDDRAGLRD